jgi:hypothetical protein
MTTLTEIIKRLNQRIAASNIFDKIYGLSEVNPNKKESGYVHYIGNGQAEVVTNYDAVRGTIFWVKRGSVSTSPEENLRVSGCKKMYRTTFPLTAYCVVRKTHLPCDSSESEDWIGGEVNRYLAGIDFGFKQSLGVMAYEVLPSSYSTDVKTLPPNPEWACLTVDFNVYIVTDTAEGCYNLCTGDPIPLPPAFEACQPCLTEVAVDGVTITGNGTVADPLVAIGGGGGGSIRVQNEGTTLTNAATNLDFIGNAVNATLNAPGDVHININQVQSDWNAASGLGEILNKPTIPAAQVNSDWNAVGGVAEILNKPTLNAGTVTSVDLSMPAAFSVSGNPVTTSGTLAVTAAGVASQYIRGDGQLANFPTSSGGGASVSYYLNGSVSQGTFGGVAMREINKVPVIGSGTDFTINADGYIQSFITDANDPNQLSIPAGNWTFETYFSASSNGGSPRFYIELYKWDGATLTLVASNSTNPENITGGTAIDLYLTALAVPQTTLAATDRLAVRFYVIHSGRTIKMHTEDNHLSQIITTFSTGITALNGLTDQVQSFAVGTSGTDFAISSVADTHTFNLPTASAANRGALSSADWSAFDGKQNALGFTPENVANKSTDVATDQASNTKYPSVKAVFDWASSVFTTTAAVASQIATALAGYVANTRNLTINGNTQTLAADRTWTTIWKDTTTGTPSSSNTNTISKTQLIPAGTFGNDIIQLDWGTVNKTGAGGAVVYRVYVNGTADLVGSPQLIATYTASNVTSGARLERRLNIKSATVTEIPTATSLLTTDIGLNVLTNYNINWAVDKYFVFCVQNTNGLDSTAVSYYRIIKT